MIKISERVLLRILVPVIIISLAVTFSSGGCVRAGVSPEETALEDKIAFVSYRDGNNEIYIMNIDGTGQINLTNNPEDYYSPCFSR